MFDSQFAFWTSKDVKEECSKPIKNCAQMNEEIFKNYLGVEKSVLQGLIDNANTELKKKEDKE
jgi:hypothetical protein